MALVFNASNGKGWLLAAFSLLWFTSQVTGQQIQWAKLYPLPKEDNVNCITKDQDGYMYAGGTTARNRIFVTNGVYRNKALFIKLDEYGDTLFIKDLGIGTIYSMTVDPFGMIRVNIAGQLLLTTLFLTVTQDGIVLQKDSIQETTPWACMIGNDSSLIIVGTIPRTGFPADRSMYFQRIRLDGTRDPLVELNPGHPNCVANRVEQLPNGHYLVSGYVGSRIASYELDEWGFNPVFKQWYQTPDFSNMNSGYVSRINGQRYMIGGAGGPCLVGQYDSLLNKYWLRKDVGTQVPPQAIVDGSVIFGYVGPTQSNTLYRVRADSSEYWKITIKDSLASRGINGVMRVNCFSYFDDESAIVAGVMSRDAPYYEDPIFLRIANVGTPVTSLLKPKKGPLANETLAPWPNPTGGTLYLKQHFDKAIIHLYSLAGKEMGEYRIRFGQPMDISQFESGIYLYRAVIDGKLYSGKILKR